MEGFTERMRRVMALANEEAQKLGHGSVGGEHVLLAMLREGESAAATAMVRYGINYAWAFGEIARLNAPGTSRWESTPTLSPRAQRIVQLAHDIAHEKGDRFVGTEHVFVAIWKEGEGAGYRALDAMGLGKVLDDLAAGLNPKRAIPKQGEGMPR